MSFTAAQVEAAIKAAYRDGSDPWHNLEGDEMPVKNPNFDQAVYHEWAAKRPSGRGYDYEAYSAWRNSMPTNAEETFYRPWAIELGGETYGIKQLKFHGGESEGELAYVVFELTKDGEPTGLIYRMDGSYYSHDGFYWEDSLRQVNVVVKSVTFYE